MSTDPEGILYCPARTNIDLSNVQYADFSKVQYFQPEDSDAGGYDDEEFGKIVALRRRRRRRYYVTWN